MLPGREYVALSQKSLSSGETADTDKKGNLVSVDNINATSLPSDDSIGLAELPNKSDVTSLDTQSKDSTDGATAADAADTVAPTVFSVDTVADASAKGGTASESDSAADDVVGSSANDVVDFTAAFKPTTAGATGAVSESTVAAKDIAVNEPTISTTATTTTTAVARTLVEEAIIATTEDVVVNAIALAQHIVRSDETVAPVTPVEINFVATIESPSLTPAEDAVASETPSVTTVESVSATVDTIGAAAEITTTAPLAQNTLTILFGSVVDDETASTEELVPQQPATAIDTTTELKLEEEPKAAVQELKAAREEKETQLPSHSFIDTPINTCSFEYSKGRRQCARGVLTVSSGPYFCQIHRRHGSHGGFVYYNKHISILLVEDFKGNKSFTRPFIYSSMLSLYYLPSFSSGLPGRLFFF